MTDQEIEQWELDNSFQPSKVLWDLVKAGYPVVGIEYQDTPGFAVCLLLEHEYSVDRLREFMGNPSFRVVTEIVGVVELLQSC